MRFIYLIILLALYYIASLYHVTALMLITLALLVLSALMMVMVHLSRLEISIPDDFVVSQDDPIISFDVYNHSSLPINKMMIVIRSEDSLHKKLKSRLKFSVRAKERKTVRIYISSQHLGIMKLYYNKAVIYDLLGLFRKRYALKKEQIVYILPSAQRLNMTLIENTSNDGQQNANNGRGKDEDYNIREYRSGDSLKSVHWNMSARFDQLYVRQYDQQANSVFLLHIAFTDQWHPDSFYKVFYHLVLTLLEHSQVFIDETSHTLIEEPVRITDKEDLDHLMVQLYDWKTPISGPLSDGYLLSADCLFYKDRQLIIDLNGDDIDEIKI